MKTPFLTAMTISVWIALLAAVCPAALPDKAYIDKLEKQTVKIEARALESVFETDIRSFLFDTEPSAKQKEQISSCLKDILTELAGNLKQQHKARETIELYEGDDWEGLYGRSGLWRKLCSDINRSKLTILEIRHLNCIYGSTIARDAVLRNILQNLRDARLEDNYAAMLLRARILTKLDGCMPAAQKLFAEIAESKAPAHIRIQAMLESTAIQESGIDLKSIIDIIRKKDILAPSTVIKTAMLQLRSGSSELLKWYLLKAEDGKAGYLTAFTADLLAEQLKRSSPEIIIDCGPFAADILSVSQTVTNDKSSFRDALLRIALDKRFHSQHFLLCAAELIETQKNAACGSENADRLKLGFLINAVNAPDNSEGLLPLRDRKTLARSAMLTACEMLRNDPDAGQLACQAFKIYTKTVGSKIDRKIEYAFASTLLHKTKSADAIPILEKIASDRNNPYCGDAGFLIISDKLDKLAAADGARRERIAAEIERYIDNTTAKIDYRSGVAERYCLFLLDNCREDDRSQSRQACEKIITIAARGRFTDRLTIPAAEAHRRLGDIRGALRKLAQNTEVINEDNAPLASAILSLSVDNILSAEDGQIETKYSLAVAAHIISIAGNFQTAKTQYLAGPIEIIQILSECDSLPADRVEQYIESLSPEQAQLPANQRIIARRLVKSRQFSDALNRWTRLCSTQNSSTSNGRKSGLWYEAKYFQLFCMAQLSGQNPDQIAHAIEVLVNSDKDMPACWKTKFQNITKGNK